MDCFNHPIVGASILIAKRPGKMGFGKPIVSIRLSDDTQLIHITPVDDFHDADRRQRNGRNFGENDPR